MLDSETGSPLYMAGARCFDENDETPRAVSRHETLRLFPFGPTLQLRMSSVGFQECAKMHLPISFERPWEMKIRKVSTLFVHLHNVDEEDFATSNNSQAIEFQPARLIASVENDIGWEETPFSIIKLSIHAESTDRSYELQMTASSNRVCKRQRR